MNIRILLLAGLTAFLFLSCSSNRKISSAEEKSLYSKLRKLEKDPGNTTLRQEAIDLYQAAMIKQQDRVSALMLSTELSRYDKLIKELEQSQKISDAIRVSPAYKYVTPPNYYQQIAQIKEDAARELSLWFSIDEIHDYKTSHQDHVF